MDEYIEREAVVMELNKTYDNMNAMGAQFYCGFMNAVHRIKDFPAADVAPVRHGRWLCVDTDTEQFFLCNRCNKKEYWESNYCPNCGAIMDVEEP